MEDEKAMMADKRERERVKEGVRVRLLGPSCEKVPDLACVRRETRGSRVT